MTINDAIRLDKTSDVTFTKHRLADATKGVWVCEAPLATRDAQTLGVGFLANAHFDSHKMSEDLTEVLIEFTPSSDITPFSLIPTRISKPTIEPLEGGGLKISLRVHVTEGHVGIVDSFFERANVGTFSLVIRPQQMGLGLDDSAATEAPVEIRRGKRG